MIAIYPRAQTQKTLQQHRIENFPHHNIAFIHTTTEPSSADRQHLLPQWRLCLLSARFTFPSNHFTNFPYKETVRETENSSPSPQNLRQGAKKAPATRMPQAGKAAENFSHHRCQIHRCHHAAKVGSAAKSVCDRASRNGDPGFCLPGSPDTFDLPHRHKGPPQRSDKSAQGNFPPRA